MQNQTMILKSEDRNKKRVISDLWKRTEKDGNEHGILIGGDIRMELDGSEGEISASAWAKPLTVIYKNPKTVFDFFHTHDEWDSPLSGADVYTFLYIFNLHSMVAITKEHLYTITRTNETPVIGVDQYKEIQTKYEKYTKDSTPPDRIEDEYYFYYGAFRQALCDATKRLAEEYKFKYEEKEL